MAKKVKSADDLDRISNMTDLILSHILSFLPTKDAIRTSILSSRWRYLFTSLSTLDFDKCLWCLPRRNVENFNNFLDKLLFSNHGSLECFRFGGSDYSHLHSWICSTLSRSAKEIVIYCGEISLLPSHLFTSHTLVTLKLTMYGDMKVPSNVSLPNLKTLHLKSVEFYSDGDSFNRLISNCLAIEDLDLDLPCRPYNISKITIHSLSLKRLGLTFYEEIKDDSPRDINYVVEINAPSLVYFRYVDLIAEGYTSSNMSSLEKAYIEIRPFSEYSVEQGDLGAIHLFQVIYNVRSLRLNIKHAEELFGTSSLGSLFTFHKLVELKFETPSRTWKGTWIMEFLHCVPNLKKLILDLADPYPYYPGAGFKSVPNEVPSCLLFHLKEIKISNWNVKISKFGGERDMFEMIGYFLKHARVLETLIIEDYSRLQSSTIDELLSLPRNSKKCEVV